MDTKFSGVVSDPAVIDEYLRLVKADRLPAHWRPVRVNFSADGNVWWTLADGTTQRGHPPLRADKLDKSVDPFRRPSRFGTYTRCSAEELAGRAPGEEGGKKYDEDGNLLPEMKRTRARATPVRLGNTTGVHLQLMVNPYKRTFPDFPRDRFPLLFSRIPEVAQKTREGFNRTVRRYNYLGGDAVARKKEHDALIADNRMRRAANPRPSRNAVRVGLNNEDSLLSSTVVRVAGWLNSHGLPILSPDGESVDFSSVPSFRFDPGFIRQRISENAEEGIREALVARKAAEVFVVLLLWQHDRLFFRSRSAMASRHAGWDSPENQEKVKQLLTSLHDTRFQLLSFDGWLANLDASRFVLSEECHCSFVPAVFTASDVELERAVQYLVDARARHFQSPDQSGQSYQTKTL